MRRNWVAAVVALASAATIAFARPRVAERFGAVKVGRDVFAIPSPERAVVMSLGYRSALADMLFANVLVQSGIHVQERRRFEFVGEYLDVINALDPTFRSPYRFADTLLVLQALPAREQEYKKAREILLRGLEVFPYDQELWVTAGQYLAYLAAPHLDPKTAEQWRLEGARLMAKGCELVTDNRNMPYACFSAAGLLSKAGHREALVSFLTRFLAVTDDPELRSNALAYLRHARAEAENERAEYRAAQLKRVWDADLPFVSRTQLMIVGPRFDTAACAGPAATGEHVVAGTCSTSWRDYWEAVSPEP